MQNLEDNVENGKKLLLIPYLVAAASATAVGILAYNLGAKEHTGVIAGCGGSFTIAVAAVGCNSSGVAAVVAVVTLVSGDVVDTDGHDTAVGGVALNAVASVAAFH